MKYNLNKIINYKIFLHLMIIKNKILNLYTIQ